MKATRLLSLLLLFALPCWLGAQAHVGSWAMSGTTPDGQSFNNTITFNANGTMTVDFGSDGSADVHSTYTVENGVFSVTDTDANSPCKGMTGKYRVVVAGNKFTATLISDPCTQRKGDGSPMVMTRR